MIEEKELIDLMTKMGDSYVRNKTEEGNLYSQQLISRLDFSKRRDQEALFQILGNALIRNDEFCVLDMLHDRGFDFQMEFQRGGTLIDFFSKYPKFKNDNRVFQKISEFTGKSLDDELSKKNLQELLSEHEEYYVLWWEQKEEFWDMYCKIASEELQEEILELTEKISNEEAAEIDKTGLSLFHQLVWHNYDKAVEILLAKGVNPNIAGGINQEENSNAYLGMTPLHIACYFGNYNMVKLLLNHGADMELCDEKGRNCLHYLSSIRFSDITRCQLQKNAFPQRAQIFPLLTCNINQMDKSNTTPLMQLLQNKAWGKLSMVLIDLYLKAGADITVTDEEGNNILMLAAKNEHITAAFKILEFTDKAYYNQQNLAGDTALHIALKHGYKIAYMLICMGADCKVKNNAGESVEELFNEKEYSECLHHAIKAEPMPLWQKSNLIIYALDECRPTNQDNIAFAVFVLEQLLKEIDPDVDKEVSYILKILYHALSHDNEFILLDTLQNSWVDLTEPISDGATLTTIRDYCLCHSYHVNIVKKLMSFYIDMNEPLRKGKTPANLLAEHSVKIGGDGESETYYAEAAKLFSVESMELCDEEGWCALHWAARQNHLEMMKVMLEKGADINITMDSETMAGRSPLHIACIYGNVEMIKLLLEYGAEESIQDVSGNTPAHYAVKEIESYIKVDEEKRVEMVKLLHAIDIPRNDGKTPLILAQEAWYGLDAPMTALLLEKGANVNHGDNNGNTPLLTYTYNKYDIEIVKTLIDNGADINARNSSGNTPLHYALKNEQESIARYLIKKGANYKIANNAGETPAMLAVENGYETVLELMDLEEEEEKETMSMYSKEQLEMMRINFVLQFGEEDADRLLEVQERLMKIASEGMTEENMQRLQEAQQEYQALCMELNEKNYAQTKEKADEDYDTSDYGSDNEDTSGFVMAGEGEPEEKSEYEKISVLYIGAFGPENGKKLARYMARMSEITNEEGLDEDNRKEYEELQEAYQELLDSLGGHQRIMEYCKHWYDEDTSNAYGDYSDDDDEDEDDLDGENTSGVEAIDEALEELYDNQEGLCYGTMVPFRFGGNDPLDMVRIFESERDGIPYWHYVTYGFSELYEKESDDEETSGFGFELTFRLKKTGEEPEKWPVSLLQNIARYVFKTGNVFAPGHHMNLNGPIQVDYDTDITAIAFMEDPELPELETPNGYLEFIEIVGITQDELNAIMCWNTQQLLETFEEFLPFGITDIDRKSFMTNEKVKQAFEEGMEKDGSSTMFIYTDFIAVSMFEHGCTEFYGSNVKKEDHAKANEMPVIYFGAAHVEQIIRMLRGRLLKGREFLIQGSECAVFFNIGNICEVEVNEDETDIYVTLTEESINEISEKLPSKAGEYLLTSGNLNFRIVKTEITDPDGNVVEVIG